MYELAIIGAGAAGLMAVVGANANAAGCKKQEGLLNGRVVIIDGNEKIGRKLYATGNGRCNMLNRFADSSDYRSGDGDSDCEEFVEKVFSVSDASFLESVFRGIGVESTYEEGGRVYPASFQASSVVEALTWAARDAGCDILLSSKVKGLSKTPSGMFDIYLEDGGSLFAKKVIVATGGKGGIVFGSSGDGYKFASSLGHGIVKPIPALAGLKVGKAFAGGLKGGEDGQVSTSDSSFLADLAGVRIACEVSFIESCTGRSSEAEQVIYKETGELQFTEEGISGICVFNISRFLRFREGVRHSVSLNFAPDKDVNSVREIIARRRKELPQRRCRYALRGMLPSKLGDFLLSMSGIDLFKPMEFLSCEEEELIAGLITNLRFTIEGASSWKDAQCTSGGIAIGEVNPSTMESRKVPGLYFAGEVLDVDGPCGGYNLTFAFSTGYIAGYSAIND